MNYELLGHNSTILILKHQRHGIYAKTTAYQLYSNHEDCFQGELATAQIKQILQALSKQLKNQRVVSTARTKIKHLRYAL